MPAYRRANSNYFGPTVPGSVAICIALVVAYYYSLAFDTMYDSTELFFDTKTPITDQLSIISFVLLIGFVASLLLDLQHGIKNVIRIDNACLVSLYFLIFFEFNFPQYDFEKLLAPVWVGQGVRLSLLGLLGLTLGRHVLRPNTSNKLIPHIPEVSLSTFIKVFWFCVAVGYFHVLIAVNFDPLEMVVRMMGPRFSEPWSRGSLGSLHTLLYELGLILFAIPALGAYILHNSKTSWFQKLLVAVAVGLTMFKGFCSGTRNQLAAYLMLYLATYLMIQKRASLMKLAVASCIIGGVFLFASHHMLQFRQMGLMRYINEKHYEQRQFADMSEDRKGYFVDYNLFAICKLMQVIPSQYDYLGGELYFWSLIKIIPRAVWPSKPEGLSLSVEGAMGTSDLTISASMVGESYMSGGYAAVFLTSFLFGVTASFWNKLRYQTSSHFGFIVYCSAFFPAVLSMRSIVWLTTAMLPTVALVVIIRYLRKQRLRQHRGMRKPLEDIEL